MFKYHSDMGHCFSKVVVVSKKKKFFFLLFLIGENKHGIGKKGGYFLSGMNTPDILLVNKYYN